MSDTTPILPLPAVPVNPTDRNTATAHGLWKGHLTLPCSFVTLFSVLVAASFLVVLKWQFDQQTQMRTRLQRQTEIIHTLLLEKGVNLPEMEPGEGVVLPDRHPARK